MTKLEADVLSTIARMTHAFEAGNIDQVMETYEPGGVVAFEPGRPLSEPETLRAAFAEFAEAKPRFAYAKHEVLVSGDLALHVAPWRMTGTGPDGDSITQDGLSVSVLRRQADGTWRLVIDNPYGDHLLAGRP